MDSYDDSNLREILWEIQDEMRELRTAIEILANGILRIADKVAPDDGI